MLRKRIVFVTLLLLFSLSACDKNASSGNNSNEKPANNSALPTDKPHKPSLVKAGQTDKGQEAPSKISNVAEDKDNPVKINSEGDTMEVIGQEEAEQFYYETLSKEIKERIDGKSYGENCDVPYEELRYVRVLYWGFDQQTHNGELIVNKAISEDIVAIFKELYESKYPIERMVLVDEYNADDNTSMEADNTSAFNYRKIDGTDRLSLHSYGLAIDINPLYNPYVRGAKDELIITPENGSAYADRSADCDYYIKEGDVCYNAFVKRGFTWGGEWKTQKDYQHFQKKLEP